MILSECLLLVQYKGGSRIFLEGVHIYRGFGRIHVVFSKLPRYLAGALGGGGGGGLKGCTPFARFALATSILIVLDW